MGSPKRNAGAPTALDEARALPFVEWCRIVCKVTFTPYQEALAKVMGGLDPTSPIDEAVWAFIGHVEIQCRRIIALRCGRGGGKTTLSALFCLWRAMVADLTGAGGGAEIVIPVVAPKIDGAKLVLKMAIHYATHGLLENCINIRTHAEARKRMAVTTTSLTLTRPHDGMSVEIRAVPAAPGGSNLVGYWIPAMVIDEAERMAFEKQDGRSITDKEQLDAAMPRVLLGGSCILISTPFDYESFMHKHVERNHGHPVDGLAAVATSRQMQPDSEILLNTIAADTMRDPRIAQRDYECIPIGRDDAYFSSADVDACTWEEPIITRQMGTGGIDLGFVSDGSGGVGGERQGACFCQTWEYLVLPRPGRPLLPSAVRGTMRDNLLARDIRMVAADAHEFSSLCEDFIPAGIVVTHAPTGANLATAFAIVREMTRAGTIKILPQTAAQMKSVITTSSGTPSVARSSKGHGDLVSALVAAVWCDRRHGPLAGGRQERPGSFRGGWTT